MAYTRHGRYIAGERDPEFEHQARRICPPDCFPCQNEADTYFYLRTKESQMNDKRIAQQRTDEAAEKAKQRAAQETAARELKDQGLSNKDIAAELGLPEVSINSLLGAGQIFKHYNVIATGERSIAVGGTVLGSVSTGQIINPVPKNYAAPSDYSQAPQYSAHPALQSTDYPQMARNATIMAFFERSKTVPIDARGAYVVWFQKTLTDWVAMTGTTVEDGLYYEVLYNGTTDLVTVHTYSKVHQQILDGYAYTENGQTSFAHFAAGRASSVYNFLNHPTQLPMQSDDWQVTFETRSFHNRKVVLRSIFTAQDMFELTYDHGANKIYVDAYKLVGSTVYPSKKVNY